jgi:hypothetical protein
MSFRLYVVFHKFLVAECYETLSEEEFKRIRFMAVNASIEKKVPEALVPYVIEERRLGWYNPFLQHNRFCESSAFFHVWKNQELLDDYIGFFHYDMLMNKEAFVFLEEQIPMAKARGERVVFTNVTLLAWPELNQVIPLSRWNDSVTLYNTLFQKNHSIVDVLDQQLPLYHSFVLDRETFHRMMTFAEKAIPFLFEAIGFDTKHLPFMIERLHAIFLVLEKRSGLIDRWISLPGITHVDRLKDSWK